MDSFNIQQSISQEKIQLEQSQILKQTILFTNKNYLTFKRDPFRLLFLFMSPIIVCLCMKFLQFEAQKVSNDLYHEVLDYPIEKVKKLDKCQNQNDDCITVGYHGEQAPYIDFVVNKIAQDNDLNISQVQKVSQGNYENFQKYLKENQNKTKIGLVFCTSIWQVGPLQIPCQFDDKNKTMVFYSIVSNHTVAPYNVFGLNKEQIQKDDLPFKFKVSIDRAILSFFSKENFDLDVSLQSFPTAMNRFVENVSVNRPFIWLIPFILLFIYLTQEIIKDKQIKIGIITIFKGLIVVGLNNKAYWISWQITGIILNIILSIQFYISGYISQIQMFQNSPFVVIFFLFFQIGFAFQQIGFLISTISLNQRQGLTIMYAILIIILMVALMFQNLNVLYLFNSNIIPTFFRTIISLFNLIPTYHFAKIFGEVQKQTEYHYSLSLNRWENGKDFDWDIYTQDVHGQFLGSKSAFNLCSTLFSNLNLFIYTLIYMLITIYFDYILASNGGKSRSAFFFLKPKYWGLFKQSSNYQLLKIEDEISNLFPMIQEDFNDVNHQVQIQNQDFTQYEKGINVFRVSKMYRNLPFGLKSKKDHQALTNFSLYIKNNELMAILGPNGAGKSTLFSLIIGLNELDNGLIYINRLNVENEFKEIRKQIGFCPQFDLLWDNLTAYEHLKIFSIIKQIPKDKIDNVIDDRLNELQLMQHKNAYICSFSGGMKRRLSLAISTLGNPRIIILDEPTTGMDPKSKREAWKLIQKIKKDKCILLTTHDMEEADILNDRIAIMKEGQIKAIGTSLELKNRYGSGYDLNIVCKQGYEDIASNFVKNNIDQCTIKQQGQKNLIINVQNQFYPQLQKFIQILENLNNLQKNDEINFRNAIQDWGISQTTMEQVFINLIQS